jgi:hypothetical protein
MCFGGTFGIGDGFSFHVGLLDIVVLVVYMVHGVTRTRGQSLATSLG